MVAVIMLSMSGSILQFSSRYVALQCTKLFSFALACLTLSILLSVPTVVLAASQSKGIPEELYEGMVKFKLNSGDVFNALAMMNEPYISKYPADYNAALHGYSMSNKARKLLDINGKQKNKLSDSERFTLGEVYYNDNDCINALKSFKGLKNKLSLDDKQRWTFYRANCFIELGSPQRAAKALRDLVGGVWAAYAYYNLAIAYAEASHDKTKALGTLWIASSLNKGKSEEELALADRINLASGSLYLEGGKPDLALEFFKKVRLDSDSTAAGLYLNGLAHLELGDFRAATQSWFSTKTYPLTNQSVAEAALAIPYAYERSGYISQALEAYKEASSGFENELRTINKLDTALEKHGAHAVLIDGSEIKGLEWFLSKGVVKNTTRAAYYRYFAQDRDIHDDIKLYTEMHNLVVNIEYWQTQLSVFSQALNSKKSNFSKQIKRFNSGEIANRINAYDKKVGKLSSSNLMTPKLSKSLQIEAMKNGVDTLASRLGKLQSKVNNGPKLLSSQLSESAALGQRLAAKKVKIEALLDKLDSEITNVCRQHLSALRKVMMSNYERAEQGLVHIFQGIAENKSTKRKKSKDGRYSR